MSADLEDVFFIETDRRQPSALNLDQLKTVSIAGCGRIGCIARAKQVHAHDSDLLDQATDLQIGEIFNVQRGL